MRTQREGDQGESSHENLNPPIPGSWTSRLQSCEKIHSVVEATKSGILLWQLSQTSCVDHSCPKTRGTFEAKMSFIHHMLCSTVQHI